MITLWQWWLGELDTKLTTLLFSDLQRLSGDICH
jgi:hypothetical protein